MVKNHLGATLGFVCVSLTLILSIFAYMLLNGSVAWFAENKDVDAENMTVRVSSPSKLVMSVEYFPISEISLSGNQNIYTFSKTPLGEDENKCLGTYSTLVAERQLLIKINLNPGVTDARIVASSFADSYLIQDRNTIINKEGNPLSSVVEFYAIDDVTITSEGYVITGDHIVDPIARFSDVDPSYGSIPVSFSPEVEIASVPIGDTDKSIYIMIDYYEKSLDYVMDHISNLMIDGSTDIVSGETVNFVCDFEILVLN